MLKVVIALLVSYILAVGSFLLAPLYGFGLLQQGFVAALSVCGLGAVFSGLIARRSKKQAVFTSLLFWTLVVAALSLVLARAYPDSGKLITSGVIHGPAIAVTVGVNVVAALLGLFAAKQTKTNVIFVPLLFSFFRSGLSESLRAVSGYGSEQSQALIHWLRTDGLLPIGIALAVLVLVPTMWNMGTAPHERR